MAIPRWSSAGASTRVVLSRVDGTLEISDIAALAGVPKEEVERALEPLVAAGAVTMSEGPRAGSVPPPAIRRSSADLSPEALPKISDEDHHRISDLYARRGSSRSITIACSACPRRRT
jgi:hypothetical protein